MVYEVIVDNVDVSVDQLSGKEDSVRGFESHAEDSRFVV